MVEAGSTGPGPALGLSVQAMSYESGYGWLTIVKGSE